MSKNTKMTENGYSEVTKNGKRESLKHILKDGFGNQWSPRCPECGDKTVEIVRPGKVQCKECG